MKLIQVKQSELSKIREELMLKQKGLCKICGCDLTKLDPKARHVDHQHFGDKLIRAVLCRRCNTCEGKLYNSYIRSTLKEQRGSEDYLAMLKGLVRYHKLKPTKYIHPAAIRKPRKRKKTKKKR